jgi:hypothetical protein
LPVENLLLHRRYWRVGPVLFRQQGTFAPFIERQIQRYPPETKLRTYLDRVRKDSAEVKYAVAQVRARSIEDATERVREAISIARLFQRVVLPHSNVDQQTFGLAIDIGSPLVQHWETGTPGHYPGGGWRRQGVLADWTFTRTMLRQVDRDSRFRYLTAALSTEPEARTDVQRRLILALRFLNRATVMVPAPIRVAMLALVLEVLLSDNKSGDLTYRIARRGAYLTCGRPTDPHGPGARPACFLLAVDDTNAASAEASRRLAAGLGYRCGWYEHVRMIYDRRNRVMHRGFEVFKSSDPATFESWVDDVILEFTSWADLTGRSHRRDLDAEIRGLVAAGVT